MPISSEILEEQQARDLAAAFVEFCGGDAARYAVNTNGDIKSGSYSWDPATDATFDAGVVAIGPDVAAVLWVADED